MVPIAHESSSTERDRIRFALSITPYLESLVRALYRREEAKTVQPSGPDESDIAGPLAAITSLLNDAPEALRLEPGPEITVNYSHFAPWPISFRGVFEQLAGTVGKLQAEINSLSRPVRLDTRSLTRELHICWQGLSDFVSAIDSSASKEPSQAIANSSRQATEESAKAIATTERNQPLSHTCREILIWMHENNITSTNPRTNSEIAAKLTGGKSVKSQLARLKGCGLTDARQNVGNWILPEGIKTAELLKKQSDEESRQDGVFRDMKRLANSSKNNE